MGKHTVWRRTFSAECRSLLFSFSFPIHPVERTPTQELTGTGPRPGRYLPCAVPCADWRHVRSASHHRYPERQRGECFRGRHIFLVDSLFDGRKAELSSIIGSVPLDVALKWHDCDATDSGWRSCGQCLSFFAKINPICKESCAMCETPKLHGGVALRGFSKYVDISTDSAHGCRAQQSLHILHRGTVDRFLIAHDKCPHNVADRAVFATGHGTES